MRIADGAHMLLYVSLYCVAFLSSAPCGIAGQAEKKQLHIGDMVQDGINAIKVVKAERKSFFEDQNGRVLPSQDSHDLIVIELKVYRNGAPLNEKATRELVELSLLADDGKIYPVLMNKDGTLNYRYILYGADPRKALEKDGFNYQVFFSVPRNSGSVRLKYRDGNPVVELGKL